MYSTFTTLEKELRHQISGDVWFDSERRKEYSSATCMYQVMPVGVVAPRSAEDVQRVVRLAAENGIAVIARGGGTGLVGQAIGFGIILDFTKHMNNIVTISDESSSITAQAGCLLNDVYTALRPLGKFYPIDPQSAKHCTVGGTVATNAAGSHGLRHGATKNQIKGLTVILSNGDKCSINPQERKNRLSAIGNERFTHVKELLKTHQNTIRERTPAVEKYSSGYNVFEALNDDNLDATRLICGSEGTLALVTDATLNILPLPKATLAAVAYFASYEHTAEGTQIARTFAPAAIELLDKSYTDVGKGLSAASDRLIDRDFQTMLLIEFEGDDAAALRDQAVKLQTVLKRAGLLLDWTLLDDPEKRSALWMLRETVSEMLNHMPSLQRKISTVEDGAVPLPNLPAYLAGLKKILDRYSISFTLYGHAGMGHIHCTTLGEIATPTGRERIARATEEIFELIMKLDGVLSAEHGDGFVRTPFLERAFGGQIYGIFKEIKESLDPQNIFNPQKIVGTQNGLFLHDLKQD